MGSLHICHPTGSPKVRNRVRGSSCPSEDIGIPQAFPCIHHIGRQAPLVPWHPRGLHGQTLQQTLIRVMVRGLAMLIALTPTSTSNTDGNCEGLFYREQLQASSQPGRSALGRDTGILEGKTLAAQKRQKGEAKTAEIEGD